MPETSKYCPFSAGKYECNYWCALHSEDLDGCLLTLPQMVHLVYVERQTEALELQALTAWAQQQGYEDLTVSQATKAAGELAKRISGRVLDEGDES